MQRIRDCRERVAPKQNSNPLTKDRPKDLVTIVSSFLENFNAGAKFSETFNNVIKALYPVYLYQESFLSKPYYFTNKSLHNFIFDLVLSSVDQNHHNPVPLEKIPKSKKTLADFVQSSEVHSKTAQEKEPALFYY